MKKGPPTDENAKKNEKDSEDKIHRDQVSQKDDKVYDDQLSRKVLLPSAQQQVTDPEITEDEIFAAEKARIEIEQEFPSYVIDDISKVGSIDSLLQQRTSRSEKISIYVNLLRFMGTVDEATLGLGKRNKKDAAKILVEKLNSVAYFLQEEDLNVKLLSLVDKRIQGIAKVIKKVDRKAHIPDLSKSIKETQNILNKPLKPGGKK